jgi:hypothetical protein
MTENEKDAYYKSLDKQVKLMKEKYGKSFDENMFKKELLFLLETKDSFKSLGALDNSIFQSNGY